MREYADAEEPLTVIVEKVEDVTILHLAGQINDMGSDTLSAKLDEVLAAGGRNIVFDLSDVTFLCSTGLGQIMRAYRAVKGCGFVRVADAQPLVGDLFTLTKLNRLLRIYKTLDEALQEPYLEPEEQ